MARRGARRVIGFYTDERRRVRPITAPVGGGYRALWYAGRARLGHPGRVDFARMARSVKAIERFSAGSFLYESSSWMRGAERSRADLVGFDHPRRDVASFENKAGRKIFVGSSRSTARLLENFKPVYGRFTKAEQKEIGELYVDDGMKMPPGSAGSCCSIREAPDARLIKLKAEYEDEAWIAMHELVHALRWRSNVWKDRDEDEKKTELETIARLKPSEIEDAVKRWNLIGYYMYVPGIRDMSLEDRIKLILRDRELVLEEMKKTRGIREAVDRAYPKTTISKAHFSPAERLDRYFEVEVEGETYKVHMHFIRPTDNVSGIVEELKQQYGEDAKIYEITDGKRVELV